MYIFLDPINPYDGECDINMLFHKLITDESYDEIKCLKKYYLKKCGKIRNNIPKEYLHN